MFLFKRNGRETTSEAQQVLEETERIVRILSRRGAPPRGDDRHAERLGAPRHGLADAPGSDDPEDFPFRSRPSNSPGPARESPRRTSVALDDPAGSASSSGIVMSPWRRSVRWRVVTRCPAPSASPGELVYSTHSCDDLSRSPAWIPSRGRIVDEQTSASTPGNLGGEFRRVGCSPDSAP